MLQLLWTGKDFAQICEHAELDESARAVLEQQVEPRAFVTALVEQDHFHAAASVLAHAFQTREGIFWAWSCARDAAGPAPNERTRRCVEAARAWIYEPTDAHRRAAFEVARDDAFKSAASMACAAVFCSGGSLTPENMPAAAPGPWAAARAIRDSVVMAAVIGLNADNIDDRYRVFLAEGIRIAGRTRALELAPYQTASLQMPG